MLLAELLALGQSPPGSSPTSYQDTKTIEAAARAMGFVPLFQRACEAVEAKATSPAEIRRVLGFGV
jgi:hypothetical protein